jgi:fibronectin type 3 domain-containing protein
VGSAHNGPYTLIAQPTGTSLLNSGRSPATPYFYVVQTVVGGAVSPNAAEATATTLALPTPPTVTATATGPSTINVTWNAVSGASYYKVFVGTAHNGPYTLIAQPTGTSLLNSGRIPSTQYFYVVQTVVSGLGVSANSTEATATTPAVPTPPTGLAAAGTSASTVSLSWTAVGGASYYQVFASATHNGPYTLLAQPTGTSLVHYGRTAGSTTFYVVRTVVTGGGVSANSGEVSATTATSPSAPPTPANVVASPGATPGEITLSSNPSAGATGYVVLRSTTAGSGYVALPAQGGNVYDDTGLTTGVTYYYVVEAVGAGGTSGTSKEASATAA